MADAANGPALSEPITNFSKNLEALREFLLLVKSFLEKQSADFQQAKALDLIPLRFAIAEVNPSPQMAISEEEAKRLREQFGSDFNVIKTEEKTVTIQVPGEAGARFQSAIKVLSGASAHQTLLYRNCLISLVSSAEWFLSQIVTQYFQAFPEAAGTKDKSITLEDLRRIGSVTEAESYLISLRVDEIMWGSLDDWLKFFRDSAKLTMSYLTEDKPQLTEVFQRRNVMVHNNGKVHHSYLTKVDENLRKDVKLGDDLVMSPAYLENAITVVERNFILIACELWKRIAPKDEARAGVLNKVAIDALLAERYLVAESASRFQIDDKQLPEKWQVYAKLNYWQTQKWLGKLDQVRGEVENADFSAKDDLIQLARLVLLDDFDAALSLLGAVVQTGKLSLKDLEEWPIFRTFRKDARVQAVIVTERSKASASVKYSPAGIMLADDEEAKSITTPPIEPIN